MILMEALPPELYEILNCAIATISFVAWLICARYLYTEYNSIRGLLRLKLAFGFTVFLTGETIRMVWVWLARFLTNTNHDASWMGSVQWVWVPVIGSLTTIAGLACIVRALIPEAWGRWGYAGSLGAVILALLATRLFR